MTKIEYYISLVLKLIIFLSATIGVLAAALAEEDSFMGGRVVFMYFTIQSNIAVGLVAFIGFILFIMKKYIGIRLQIIKLMATVSITLTGVVFCFVLAPTLGEDIWNLQNILTHVVVPTTSIIDYVLVGSSYTLKMKHIGYVLLPPFAYAIYASIGYIAGWEFSEGIHYPYFFLNWGSPLGAFGFGSIPPYMGCVWWILCLLIFLLFLGSIYVQIVRIRRRT